MIRRYSQFWFFIKGLGTSFSTIFVYGSSRKIFVMSYFINWPSFIVWLLLLIVILGTMCIVIICCPVCDVINFKINHSFLVKPFFYITKKSEQTVNISETKRAFNMKQKVFFIIFKEPSLRQTKQLLWKLRVRP